MSPAELLQAAPWVCDNRGMPRQFEFADSEISRIHRTAEGCSIEFSAALISERQGIETQRRYSNGLRLVLNPCPPALAHEAQAFGLLASGWLQLGGNGLRCEASAQALQVELLAC